MNSHKLSITLGTIATIIMFGGCGSGIDPPQTSPSPVVATRTAGAGEASAAEDEMKVRDRIKHRAGGVLDLTFDDLEFEIERDADFERSMLGEEIEAMKGKPVILRGYILDAGVFQTKGIKQFVLVRDNQECCFGPGAYLYHNCQVEMVEGQSVDFTTRVVIVKGTLNIKPYLVGDKCYSVYHITAESVVER